MCIHSREQKNLNATSLSFVPKILILEKTLLFLCQRQFCEKTMLPNILVTCHDLKILLKTTAHKKVLGSIWHLFTALPIFFLKNLLPLPPLTLKRVTYAYALVRNFCVDCFQHTPDSDAESLVKHLSLSTHFKSQLLSEPQSVVITVWKSPIFCRYNELLFDSQFCMPVEVYFSLVQVYFFPFKCMQWQCGFFHSFVLWLILDVVRERIPWEKSFRNSCQRNAGKLWQKKNCCLLQKDHTFAWQGNNDRS